MSSLWPHQQRGLEDACKAITGGENAICVTSPTGGGKSRMMLEMIAWAKQGGRRVSLYTNRRALLDQTQRVLAAAGVQHGIRAAGFTPQDHWAVQLSSIQTEIARVYRSKTWTLHDSQLVLVDEAHQQGAEGAEQIIKDHKATGAAVVGFTATPVDLAHIYDSLVVAGVNSELRACGAHVPCSTYGPDEPDARALKTNMKTGEFTEGSVRKAIMTKTIFGRVLEGVQRLNPDHRPMILFAPGVKESIWFAEQFRAAGISAAHIDGDSVCFGEHDRDGHPILQPSTREVRDQILDDSRTGKIKVLCNRFVLREGIDAPWLYHTIFATSFGSLSSYLQAGGRLLRSHPSLDHVVLQDHGGNWWRHGSLNADRVWDLTWTNNMYTGLRAEAIREKKEPEPIVCPSCAAIRSSGRQCPKCGYMASGKSRMVVQVDGTLKEMKGDIFKQRRVEHRNNTQELWERMYHRARSQKWDATFAQAEALFFYENHYWPPRSLPYMPTIPSEFYSKVSAVPRQRLRQESLTSR
jgi:superfamily II DNA or RNA helicase